MSSLLNKTVEEHIIEFHSSNKDRDIKELNTTLGNGKTIYELALIKNANKNVSKMKKSKKINSSLKFAWSVDDFKACCHNCISMIEVGNTFDCKLKVEIKDKHFSKLNSTVCKLHKFYKNIKIKSKKFKNKSARF